MWDTSRSKGHRARLRTRKSRARGNHPRIVHDDADDLLGAPHELGGLELDLGAAADGADLEVRPAGAQHLDAPRGSPAGSPRSRRRRRRRPRPSAVRTSSTRSLRSGTSLRLIVWSAPNARASSSRPGIWSTTITEAAPMSLATAAACTPRPPAPWMTTRTAEAEAGLVQPEDHLGQRAVHRRHQRVGQLVRHLEEVAAGPQIVVLGEGAVEVRELARSRAAARSWPGSRPAPC